MPKQHEDPKPGITVLGEKTKFFQPYRWREGLLFFLQEVWSEHYSDQEIVRISITLAEKKSCGVNFGVNISFSSVSQTYLSYGIADKLSISEYRPEQILYSSPRSPGDFERSIAQFVKCRRYKVLVLPLTNPRHICTLVLVNRNGWLDIGTIQ